MVYIPKDVPPDEINNSELDSKKVLIRGGLILLGLIVTFYLLSLYIPKLLTKVTPLSFDKSVGELVHKKMSVSKKPNEKLDRILKLTEGKLENAVSKSRFYIVTDKVENAFAAPGGNVYFTESFLEAAESDNEILFVLGHELGHQKYRHPTNSLYTNFLSSALLSLIGGVDRFSEMAFKATRTSFSRDQETEADLYGLELIQKIYGHTDGAFNFFERMNKKYGFLEAVSGSVFSSHPLSKERVRHLYEVCRDRFKQSSCLEGKDIKKIIKVD